MPVGLGIQLSGMSGNTRRASFAVRADMIVDVPKASLGEQKLWEVPAGTEMPLEVTFSRWGILSLDILYQDQGRW